MTNNIRVTYFDTAMILIEADGVRLLTDPVLDPSGSAFDYGPVRLEKISPASISPQRLGRIDAVLLSHDQHADNLDNAGRELLSRIPRVLTTPFAASRLGGAAEGLSSWQSVIVKGANGSAVTITAVPAQHSSDFTKEITGPVTGFLITTCDGKRIYISGDTILFDGTDEIAARCAPVDLAILHVGDARIEAIDDLKVSLSAEEAVLYAESLGARRVIPIHFEGWKHFTEDGDRAASVFAASKLASRAIRIRSGETVVID
jgi:L-ascorbate metabolism protein UlaG (beta-lactamase superfamily)